MALEALKGLRTVNELAWPFQVKHLLAAYESLGFPAARSAPAEERYARLAHLFEKESILKSDEEASLSAIEKVREMNEDLGIPSCLKEAGVKEGDLGALAQQAIEDPCHLTNPPSVPIHRPP